MFEYIIDIGTGIYMSFIGSSKQRKAAGAIVFLTLLAIAMGCFSAWVSQPRYQDFLFGLTNMQAWIISSAVALGMSFGITKLAYDLYRKWAFKEGLPKSFTALLLVIAFIGIVDCSKNLGGSKDRTVFTDEVDKYANGHPKPYESEISSLQSEKQAIYKQYIWKGKLYFAKSQYTPNYDIDRKRVDEINTSLSSFESKQLSEIEEYNSLRNERNTRGKEKSESAHSGLWWMALFVYLLQFVINYFLVGAVDELDGKKNGKMSFGKSSLGAKNRTPIKSAAA